MTEPLVKLGNTTDTYITKQTDSPNWPLYVDVIVFQQYDKDTYGYEVRWDGAKHRVRAGFVGRDTARKAAREWLESDFALSREHWDDDD